MDASPPLSYWCYSCHRFVRPMLHHQEGVLCPRCRSGFLEEMDAPPRRSSAAYVRRRRNRRSAAADHSPFNPVIVIRRSPLVLADDRLPAAATTTFDLFYDDGAGSGLRPLPETMADFLMGSGFDHLLHQLVHIEAGAVRPCQNPPASKSAVDSMPTIVISACHVDADSHCAVCKEPFDLGTEAREMPCAHIFHQDCILPWLALRSSCPVCRHQMPTEAPTHPATDGHAGAASEEDTGGLTIWRLPGGGFAVGRFAAGTRAGGEREQLPAVYTEMDGAALNDGGAPTRMPWSFSSRENRSSGRSIITRLFHNVVSCFRHAHATQGLNSSPRSAHRSAGAQAGDPIAT
ncbi:hypothetical protein GUJ93_ZPchr0001g29551 [Zizania palustris]|uniref:RING-type E3 ubiquitin transferase n=1 Tax=Zizania palustris TaxID=103762 RepID=A0A8J5V1C4_ZIZPA|nr:hypothetical protein GUJ93_ZPchr0001g29551 [Zizania palustris]